MFTWKITPDGPEGTCLSTDDKPTIFERLSGKTEPIPNGTPTLEIDTSSVWMWDAENNQWRKL